MRSRSVSGAFLKMADHNSLGSRLGLKILGGLIIALVLGALLYAVGIGILNVPRIGV